MKNYYALLIIASLFVFGSCTQQVDIESEKVQVDNVLDQVIKVWETEDMQSLSDIFAHDSDMVIFGTEAGERVVGWDSFQELMQNQFDTTDSSKISVSNRVVKFNNTGNAAWFSEVIDWHLVSDGQDVNLNGLRGTGVLEKRNGKWVVVQLHYSIPGGQQQESMMESI